MLGALVMRLSIGSSRVLARSRRSAGAASQQVGMVKNATHACHTGNGSVGPLSGGLPVVGKACAPKQAQRRALAARVTTQASSVRPG